MHVLKALQAFECGMKSGHGNYLGVSRYLNHREYPYQVI